MTGPEILDALRLTTTTLDTSDPCKKEDIFLAPFNLPNQYASPFIPSILGRQLSFKNTNLPVSLDIATKPRVARPVGDLAVAIERPTIYDTTPSLSPSRVGISILLLRYLFLEPTERSSELSNGFFPSPTTALMALSKAMASSALASKTVGSHPR